MAGHKISLPAGFVEKDGKIVAKPVAHNVSMQLKIAKSKSKRVRVQRRSVRG